MKNKHYIIGDVHGMLDTLVALLEKIPKHSHVLFVGDLIDRGADSSKVVKLVRTSGYKVVLGNHENTMIRYFKDYFSDMSTDVLAEKWSVWLMKNGGKNTLQSYEIWENINPSTKTINRIKDDLHWMKSLPLYIELKTTHQSQKSVVVSHSNITNVWHLRASKKDFEKFKDTVTRTRDLKHNLQSGIFNIYGHTIVKTPTRDNFSVNIDTGCYAKEKGYGVLTAYCVEDDSFISQIV